jgi:hypothetical protein
LSVNRYPFPYSEFVLDNFVMVDCERRDNATCRGIGCTRRWSRKPGTSPDTEQVRKLLTTWQAFRNKPGCQATFLANVNRIDALVRPLSDGTAFCNLDKLNYISVVFDTVRSVLCGSVVCTTKALHFFAPEMFLILDREQVFSKWKRETRSEGNPLSGSIEGINGAKYARFIKAAVEKLSHSLAAQQNLVIDGRSCGIVSNVDQLRWLSPLLLRGQGLSFPNTIGKALDNIIRNAPSEP